MENHWEFLSISDESWGSRIGEILFSYDDFGGKDVLAAEVRKEGKN